jgi:hypothetical protein
MIAALVAESEHWYHGLNRYWRTGFGNSKWAKRGQNGGVFHGFEQSSMLPVAIFIQAPA